MFFFIFEYILQQIAEIQVKLNLIHFNWIVKYI